MATRQLIVDFWDVGQGNASVIHLPSGELLLVDVGPLGSPVIDWLSDHPKSILAAVITHNDGDHAGSLPSLVKIPGVIVKTVYMLLDRDKKHVAFQRIWRPIREEEMKGKLKVVGLSDDRIIWDGGFASLHVLYPSFSENIEAGKPNETSAVLCLYLKGVPKLVWSGDAPIRKIAEKCCNMEPYLLDGPHHGAPVDRKEANFQSHLDSISPKRGFISVGTHNRYSHPNPSYLESLARKGCVVQCSQLTRHCDPVSVDRKNPVLQSAALLGLRAPHSGVSCRGCLRITVENGMIVGDRWDEVHRARIGALRRPLCLS